MRPSRCQGVGCKPVKTKGNNQYSSGTVNDGSTVRYRIHDNSTAYTASCVSSSVICLYVCVLILCWCALSLRSRCKRIRVRYMYAGTCMQVHVCRYMYAGTCICWCALSLSSRCKRRKHIYCFWRSISDAGASNPLLKARSQTPFTSSDLYVQHGGSLMLHE